METGLTSRAPVAALLMPAGFFVSSVGKGRTSPDALIALGYTGGVILAAGLASLGIGLLAS